MESGKPNALEALWGLGSQERWPAPGERAKSREDQPPQYLPPAPPTPPVPEESQVEPGLGSSGSEPIVQALLDGAAQVRAAIRQIAYLFAETAWLRAL